MRGKVRPSGRLVLLYRDHPRICGEKPLIRLRCRAIVGSPPHMRGKVHCVLHKLRRVGITPAYAGKRQALTTVKSRRRDHPRVCGEKFRFLLGYRLLLGSPPRMRGKELSFVGFQLHTGITPAYAGKRPPGSSSGSWKKDHPRVCGEKTVTALKSAPK